LGNLVNGAIAYSSGDSSTFDHGVTATHMCNTGFFLEGTSVRTCQGDGVNVVGSWTGAHPACSGWSWSKTVN